MGSKKQSSSPRQEDHNMIIMKKEKEIEKDAIEELGAEWMQERKRLKEEVRRLRKVVEEKEERIRLLEKSGRLVGEKKEWLFMEERDWRDEAVDKWKKLYLVIKKELDHLIQGGVYWGAESEDMMKELKRKLEGREETIKVLKMQLASVEYEGYKSKREVDILRQSLRIVSSSSNNNKATAPKTPSWK